MCAIFSLEILQAALVTGLMADSWTLMKVTLSLKLQLLLE